MWRLESASYGSLVKSYPLKRNSSLLLSSWLSFICSYWGFSRKIATYFSIYTDLVRVLFLSCRIAMYFTQVFQYGTCTFLSLRIAMYFHKCSNLNTCGNSTY